MMLTLSEEQEELRELVRRVVTEHSDSRAMRAALASEEGWNRRLWESLAELGLVGITVPEEFGGAGAGAIERAVVLEELGRGVAAVPYLASAVMAADVMSAADPAPLRSDLLTRLASGEAIGAVAVAEGDDAWPRERLATHAVHDGGSWRVTGVKSPVIAGALADVLLVFVDTPDGPQWLVVDPAAAGVRREALAVLDPTRPMARIVLDDVAAKRVEVADPLAVLDRVRDRAAVALAAESVGTHERALEMTVDHARIRVQFGRPIGSFQAVKHGLADVYTALELSRSVVRYAAWTCDESTGELPTAAALAMAYVPHAAFEAAAAAIHFHGGIGFTAEHDAHFFFTRAKSAELVFGGAGERLTALADRLGI